MSEAIYTAPVAGETESEAFDRKGINFGNFRKEYFEIFRLLPSDIQFDLTQRYHLDQPVTREEMIKLAEDNGIEVPAGI